MDNDLDKIEEELKKKAQEKKEQKVSGRSVLELKKIIEEKSKDKREESDSNYF